MPRERLALDLDACPEGLRDELTRYIRWCEASVVLNRSQRIAKRPVTSRHTAGAMLRLAGFAVRELRYPLDRLTLEGLCQPDFLVSYANWWLTRRGRMTVSLKNELITPTTIARHWLKNPAFAETITKLYTSLPPIAPVRQKEQRWLSLRELEDVGLSGHPLNPRRLQEYPFLRQPTVQARAKGRWVLSVCLSLVIRLLIRLPMRQRCIREMELGKNLYQDRQRVWQIRFVGTELKVSQSNGGINRYEFPFPTELVPLLEEWLNDWRARVAAPDKTHVFLHGSGRPFTWTNQLAIAIARVTYRFTGVGVTPHMIRDIWATEYLNTHHGDVMGCARRLGNTPQMVMRHYAHVLKGDADARAETFLRGTFANGQRTSPTSKR